MNEKTLEEGIEAIINQASLSQRPCKEVEDDFEIITQREAAEKILSLVVARLEKVKNSIIACDRDCMVSVVDTCIQAIWGK